MNHRRSSDDIRHKILLYYISLRPWLFWHSGAAKLAWDNYNFGLEQSDRANCNRSTSVSFSQPRSVSIYLNSPPKKSILKYTLIYRILPLFISIYHRLLWFPSTYDNLPKLKRFRSRWSYVHLLFFPLLKTKFQAWNTTFYVLLITPTVLNKVLNLKVRTQENWPTFY